MKCAEADEFESVEMRLAMAENDEMSLEMFEMIEVTAFIED